MWGKLFSIENSLKGRFFLGKVQDGICLTDTFSYIIYIFPSVEAYLYQSNTNMHHALPVQRAKHNSHHLARNNILSIAKNSKHSQQLIQIPSKNWVYSSFMALNISSSVMRLVAQHYDVTFFRSSHGPNPNVHQPFVAPHSVSKSIVCLMVFRIPRMLSKCFHFLCHYYLSRRLFAALKDVNAIFFQIRSSLYLGSKH